MDKQEILDRIAIAQANLEWEHDLGIAAALDVAMKRCKDWEKLKEEIKEFKSGIIASSKLGRGAMMGLSYVEGAMAEMENEDE